MHTPGYSQSIHVVQPFVLGEVGNVGCQGHATSGCNASAEDVVSSGLVTGRSSRQNLSHGEHWSCSGRPQIHTGVNIARRYLVVGSDVTESKVYVRKLSRVDLPHILVQAIAAS